MVEYVAELRRLATHCEFGAYLDEALRDRFVCGLKDEGTQKALLMETELYILRKGCACCPRKIGGSKERQTVAGDASFHAGGE